MAAKELLGVRKAIKRRKPSFKRSQTNQFAKFKKDGWRKPKGMGNKIRRQRRGHIKMPRVGFGSPNAVKGLSGAGLVEVVVSKMQDLETITKEQAVVLSSTVGAKKRLEILQEAKKKGLQVANVKSIDDAIKAYTKEKKVAKKKTVEKKEEAKADSDKKEEAPKKETKTKAEEKKPAKEAQK